MENEDARWRLRFEQYKKALFSIEKELPDCNTLSDLEKDGLLLRFGITFHLAWKMMQDYLKHSGYNDIKGPRANLTQMAHDGFIDSFIWEEILTARNELNHIYDESISRIHLDNIVNNFLPAFRQLQLQMEQKL